MLTLIAEPTDFSSEAKEKLKTFSQVVEFDCQRQDLLKKIEEVDALVIRLRNRIDKEILDQAKNLKYIVTPTTGLNHIDLEEADKRKIQVVSLKGEVDFLKSIAATAELTWGLILSLLRNIPQALGDVALQRWDRDEFRGHDLKGKTLGVVGYGRLGQIVAGYAQAFGMSVIASDPHVLTEDCPFPLLSLADLLGQADIVTLHVGLDQSTKGFFGKSEFQKMKKGSCFINTARGELVDENALLSALQDGTLAGAALDVLGNETGQDLIWMQENQLWQYSRANANLLITPHIGGATFESMAATEIFIVEKLKKKVEANALCQH